MLILGHVFLSLGILGAILPILPTTPFLLLAVFFYSKSNSKLHHWLMSNKYFGPSLEKWFHHGVIGLKAKIFATAMIGLVSFWRIPLLTIPMLAKIIAEIVLLLVVIFIWSRPSDSQ